SASNAAVWNNWSTVLHGLRWMFQRDAPLLMNPKPSWHKYTWLAEFAASIPQYRANTIKTARLAIAARQHLYATAEKENIAVDLERRGILHIYRTQADYRHASATNALLLEAGLDQRPVTAAEIRAIEPAIAGEYYGGFFTPSDATGDIHKFVVGL